MALFCGPFTALCPCFLLSWSSECSPLAVADTNFSYKWSNTPPADVVTLPATVQDVASFSVLHTVWATNTGTRTSDVVVLAFIVRVPGSPADTPLRKLFGFERFSAVEPGETSHERLSHSHAPMIVYISSGILHAKQTGGMKLTLPPMARREPHRKLRAGRTRAGRG